MLKITIDTREQQPFSFPEGTEIEYSKLDAGDYAISGDPSFAIERKSISDFIGTISSGWERFLKEIERMKNYPAKIVIVEGDFVECVYTENNGDIIPPQHNHFKITPQFVAKRIAELSLMGVCILFAGDSGLASALAYRILWERYNAIKE